MSQQNSANPGQPQVKDIPLEGLEGLKQNWKTDLLSGFIIFLLALPLCLGIAMASGVPPIAGIIAGVVGGIITSLVWNGSYVTITGPAAGLAIIVLGAVEQLGQGDPLLGYQLMLAVVVVTGLLQIILGRLGYGVLGSVFPSSVIHGMLAAIGILIFAKQIHVALGVKPDVKEPLDLLLAIPKSISLMNPEIALIGLLSVFIMVAIPLAPWKWMRKIPAPLLVVLIAISLGHYFDVEPVHKYLFLNHTYELGPKFLVTLPGNILNGFTFPDFSQVFSGTSLKFIITFTLVASLESLLSASAVEKLDPYKRKSDLNKELMGKGLGNVISGLLGGLPMIAEIVRSSANVSNGTKSRWANFFHGCFMLLFVIFFPGLLHQIPLAALGGILMVVGYRLASPSNFKKVFLVGTEQLIIFSLTIIGTIVIDLLAGIAIGVLVKLGFEMFHGLQIKNIFRPDYEIIQDAKVFYVSIKSALTFSNFLALKKVITHIPEGQKIVFDFTEAILVDHTVQENLHDFENDYTLRGGIVEKIGLQQLISKSDHPLAVKKRIPSR